MLVLDHQHIVSGLGDDLDDRRTEGLENVESEQRVSLFQDSLGRVGDPWFVGRHF